MLAKDINNVGQLCVDKGMPDVVAQMIDYALWCLEETCKVHYKDVHREEITWSSFNVNHQTLESTGRPDAYFFKIGFVDGLFPFRMCFFPSQFQLKEFASILQQSDPENFFKPLEAGVDIEAYANSALNANGGGNDAGSDGALPLALCVMDSAATYDGITAKWYGYDVKGAQLAVVVDCDDQRWMFVIRYHDLHVSRSGKSQ